MKAMVRKFILIFLVVFLSITASNAFVLTISGVVYSRTDTNIRAAGLSVYLFEENNYNDTLDAAVTTSDGTYSLTYPNATFGQKYEIVVVDKCDSVYRDTITMTNSDMDTTLKFYVSCAQENVLHLTGEVKDGEGKPFRFAKISFFKNDRLDNDLIGQVQANIDGLFEYDINFIPETDTAIYVSVFDNCGNEVFNKISLSGLSGIIDRDVSLQVSCGWDPDMVFIQGTLYNGADICENSAILVHYQQDVKKIFVRTDKNGIFKIAIHKSLYQNDPLILTFIDDNFQRIDKIVNVPDDGILDNFEEHLSAEPLKLYTISGTAYSFTKTTVPYVKVTGSLQNHQAVVFNAFTNKDGHFKLHLFAPELTENDTLTLTAGECAGAATETLVIGPGDYDLGTDIHGVNCSPVITSNFITITGIVTDSSGNAVPSLDVILKKTYESQEFIGFTNDTGGFTINIPVPEDTAKFMVGVNDYCTQVLREIEFDFSRTEFDLGQIKVPCPTEKQLVIEGQIAGINGSDTIPISGARVKMVYLNGNYRNLQTIANAQGFYKFVAGRTPVPGDTVIIYAEDGGGNVDSTFFVYNSDVEHYQINIYSNVLLQPFTDYDTMIVITGQVLSQTDNSPVKNALVGAYFNAPQSGLGNVPFLDSMFYAVTNAQGFYRLRIPIPYIEDSLTVDIFDGCSNYYQHTLYFDFNNFRFNNIDFTIDCPVQFDSTMQPGITLAINQNWQNYNEFDFDAVIYNQGLIQSDILYFIWHIGSDTVVTSGHHLHYVFPQVDTCVNVYVQVAFSDNTLLTSPAKTVCVSNPFEEIGSNCYISFVAEKQDETGQNFVFYPYLKFGQHIKPQQIIWDFGDGNTLTVTDSFDNPVSHRYDAQGAFDVLMTATFIDTINNNTHTVQWLSPIWAGPDTWYPDSCAALFYTEVDSQDVKTIHFNDISYPGNRDSIVSYYWDFGNGQSSLMPNPTVTYDTAGNYSVYMYIVTSNGCYDDFTVNLEVGKQYEPILFYPDTVGGTKSYAVKFHNISHSHEPTWTWDFGEEGKGSVLSTKSDTIIHYYQDTGYYDVSLINPNTGAGFTMRIHVVSNNQVIPIIGMLIPQGATSNVQTVVFNTIKVYPNPASEFVKIVLPQSMNNSRVDIYNVSGQIVKTLYLHNISEMTLSVKDLASGTYFVRAKANGTIAVSKFVKQ